MIAWAIWIGESDILTTGDVIFGESTIGFC